MNSSNRGCQPALLMRYMDQELGDAERSTVFDHVKQCYYCQQVLKESQSLSALFKENMEEAVKAAPLAAVERFILADEKPADVGSRAKVRGLWLKRALIPAGVVAAATFLFFAVYGPSDRITGPSAIINSFTAEAASVMILETPETRQTILWFQEIPGQGDDDDGMQQV